MDDKVVDDGLLAVQVGNDSRNSSNAHTGAGSMKHCATPTSAGTAAKSEQERLAKLEVHAKDCRLGNAQECRQRCSHIEATLFRVLYLKTGNQGGGSLGHNATGNHGIEGVETGGSKIVSFERKEDVVHTGNHNRLLRSAKD